MVGESGGPTGHAEKNRGTLCNGDFYPKNIKMILQFTEAVLDMVEENLIRKLLLDKNITYGLAQ